jgi:N-acetylmuramoyl-L-alanine amidase
MRQLINSQFSSPNFSGRIKKIKFIILHYTEMTFEDAIERLCDPMTKVSTHYLIKADGEIFQLVDDANTAWHAGVSSWHAQEALNENSIGIEIDSLGISEFNKEQIDSCISLCQKLVYEYNIPRANILAHSDIAPGRKIDPGIYFSWEILANNKLGMWHDINDKKSDAPILFSLGESSQKILNIQNNLKRLGYKINPTGIFDRQTNLVIRAFQSHFYPGIIIKRGIDFYRDMNSEYFWDTNSDDILLSLLRKL